MKSINLRAAFLILSCCSSPLRGDETFLFNNLHLAVPDGQPAGISDVQTISSSIQQIGAVQVTLNISGNFNGDLYCYLRYENALAVLLNRSGRTAGSPAGYDDNGFQITLSDGAANGDIHLYRGVFILPPNSLITGLWQPDARNVNPTAVLDTDPRTAGLSVFNGLDPNGAWTIFIADLASGGTSVLDSWQLDISPVPEPSGGLLLLLGGMVMALAGRVRSVVGIRMFVPPRT